MTFPSHPPSSPDAYFRDGLHAGAGALTSHRKKRNGKDAAESEAATEAWTNEGGSTAPAADRARSNREEPAQEVDRRRPISGK